MMANAVHRERGQPRRWRAGEFARTSIAVAFVKAYAGPPNTYLLAADDGDRAISLPQNYRWLPRRPVIVGAQYRVTSAAIIGKLQLPGVRFSGFPIPVCAPQKPAGKFSV